MNRPVRAGLGLAVGAGVLLGGVVLGGAGPAAAQPVHANYWTLMSTYRYVDYGGPNQAMDACIGALQGRTDRARCVHGESTAGPAVFLQAWR